MGHPRPGIRVELDRLVAAGDADELLPVEVPTGEDDGHGVITACRRNEARRSSQRASKRSGSEDPT